MARLNLPRPRTFKIAARPLKRAFAFVIDLLVIDMILFFPFRILFKRLVPDLSFASLNELISNSDFTNFFVAVAFAMGILSILYFAILEYKIQQTVGKILLKVRVESERKELQLWQCIVRSIFLIPVFPFVILWAADVIYLFFNHQRQRLLEVISKTRTVETILEV